jgi:UDPglucose 6-dehydrogenase
VKTIAVFGCGFVGGTTADFLEETGSTVIRVDPVKYPDQDPLVALKKADGVVIAVPTPMGDDGQCDDSIVRSLFKIIGPKRRVLLKSTVTMDNIVDYPKNVVYNPEFLRERCAMDDFKAATFQIFGTDEKGDSLADTSWWAELFEESYKALGTEIECVFTDRPTASMIKYVHNSWLATKVAWFHELYASLPKQVNYDSLTGILGMFDRIGPDMMAAPNFEGSLGYGGACFPKDVSALLKILPHRILENVHATNSELNKIKAEQPQEVLEVA